MSTQSHAIPTLAYAAYEMGFNVVPLREDKKPNVAEWELWQTQRQTPGGMAALPWHRITTVGVGVIAGAVSGYVVGIDADKAPGRHVPESILARLGLPRDYPWLVHTPRDIESMGREAE